MSLFLPKNNNSKDYNSTKYQSIWNIQKSFLDKKRRIVSVGREDRILFKHVLILVVHDIQSKSKTKTNNCYFLKIVYFVFIEERVL